MNVFPHPRSGRDSGMYVRLLHGLSAALARSEQAEEAGAALVEVLTEGLGAETVVVTLADERSAELRVVAAGGLPAAYAALSPLPVSEPFLSAAALRSGADVWIEQPGDWQGFEVAPGVAGGAGLPMAVAGRPLGAVTLAFAGYMPFGEDVRMFARTAVQMCAQSIYQAALVAEQHEALYEREHFLSIASHELRSPLTALTLKLESLAFKMGQPAAQSNRAADTLKQCGELARHLDTLIANLLDQAKAATGKLGLERKHTDLGELLRFIADTMEQSAERAGVRFTYVAPVETVVGRWDPVRIEQVAMNLLVNALKYGRGAPVKLSAGTQNGWVWFEVADEGPGIAEDRLPRIFERYNRAGRRDAGGLGLGLYLAREFVRAHGGYIRVDTKLGAGSKFKVFLPIE